MAKECIKQFPSRRVRFGRCSKAPLRGPSKSRFVPVSTSSNFRFLLKLPGGACLLIVTEPIDSRRQVTVIGPAFQLLRVQASPTSRSTELTKKQTPRALLLDYTAYSTPGMRVGAYGSWAGCSAGTIAFFIRSDLQEHLGTRSSWSLKSYYNTWHQRSLQ